MKKKSKKKAKVGFTASKGYGAYDFNSEQKAEAAQS